MSSQEDDAGPGDVRLAPVDDQVYQILRYEIIRGTLEPGAVLKLRELATRFEVSTTPVREALERLKSDGLCNQTPHRGTRVVALSLQEFEDIYAVRIGLEVEAVQRGLARLDDRGVARVRENWVRALQLWDGGREPSLDEYFPFMNQITMTCIEATEMPRLQLLVADYRRYAERYVRAALTDLEVLRDDVRRQEKLVIACERRDPVEAGATVRELLQWTVDRLRPQLENEGSST